MEGGSQHWYQEAIVDVADELRADQGVGHLRQKDTGLSVCSSVCILHTRWNLKDRPCFHLLSNTSDPTMT